MEIAVLPTPRVNWKMNLFIIWLSQFLAMVGFGCCMPFIPLLLKENLHIDDPNVRGVYTSIYYLASMLSLCVATSVWGVLADRFGRKLMLLRASYAAALFYPLLAFAPNFWVLASIRFVCSFFSGTVNPAQTLLIATSPSEKHGWVLGVLSTAVSSGNMLGYLLGGLLVDRFGYTCAFVTCGAIYLTSAILVHIFARDDFSVALAKKQRAKSPHKFKDVATPAVIWLLVMFLLVGVSTRLIQPYMALLVERVQAERAAFYTGIVSSASSLGGFFSGLCLGWLCDRFAPRKLLLPLLIIGGIFTAAMAYSTNIAMLIITKFVAAFAGGGIKPVLQLMLTKITRPELRGTYFGWSGSVNTAGGIVCSFLGGSVIWLTDVRGVYMAAALILIIMIPLMIPTVRAIKKEFVVDPDATAKDLKKE
ncbi:MAG: multidrug efflux MFS transporter [Lentisphaerae bacterium]|nr:multidrug efflux MFS transporter [Lentisphaerota bacterium]